MVLFAASSFAQPQAFRTQPESGETIFRQRCGGCHGLDGKADTTIGKRRKMRDLTSPDVKAQSDEQLLRSISNGYGRMPAYGRILGEQKVREVIAYIRSMPD